MTAAPKLRFTFHEYLEVDEAGPGRHEFLGGLILAMAGGTPEHARLATAVSRALGRELSGKRCAVFSEALRIRGNVEFAAYPDVTVVCGKLEYVPGSTTTIVNPSVVVEVLSPGTADYDRGEKLEQYKSIPSLQHVVLVAPDAVTVTVISRGPRGFTLAVARPGERAILSSIGCELDVSEIFHDPLAS